MGTFDPPEWDYTSSVPSNVRLDRCIAQTTELLRVFDHQLGAPRCPCCGEQTRFIDKDKFGTTHCECETHGPYTIQVAA